MKMGRAYVALWSGVVTGVFGQLMLKAGAQAPSLAMQLVDPWTVGGILLYVLATVCYMVAIREIPLSVAFPSISLSYIFVLVFGSMVFGEQLSVTKVAGVVMIGVGVWVLNRDDYFIPVAVRRIDADAVEQPAIPAEFDRHAASYDGGMDGPVKRLLGSADHFMEVKASWLLRHEAALRTEDVKLLDYGCGAGDLMRMLVQLGARARVTGCDVSGGMLAEAQRRWQPEFGPPPHLAVQDGARTDFPDAAFDIVVVSAVLHHVPVEHRPAVFEELARVLKPGGRLYVFEHNPRNPLVRYVVANTKIDENAILLDPREVCARVPDALRNGLRTDYLMFTPPRFTLLRAIDRLLAWLPFGAQYAVAARKAA